MLKVYYAHPISLYNTPQERRDIAVLEALGFEVVNPNSPEHDAGYNAIGSMRYFAAVVEACDVMALRAFPDGSISAGVGAEYLMAIDCCMPIIELPTAVKRRTLPPDQTREFLAEAGQR